MEIQMLLYKISIKSKNGVIGLSEKVWTMQKANTENTAVSPSFQAMF
jgi:hypothetical protein